MQNSSGKILESILENMDYNEAQMENFGAFMNWITERNGKVESIVHGTCLTDSADTKDEFSLGDQLISVCYLDKTKFQHYLELQHKDKIVTASEITIQEKVERLTKLKKLIGDWSVDLCAAECLATHVPQWQLQEYDVPTWNNQLLDSSINDDMHNSFPELSVKGKKKTVFIQLSREGYSLEKILPILAAAIKSDEEFILVMNSRTSEYSSCILPLAYLIDAVNKSNIRKHPIDLLLVDHSFEDTMIKVLEESKKADSSEIYLWGDLQKSKFPTLLSSGVVVGPTEFGERAHFILDSLADVPTTVESIVAEVWSSGVRVNHRTRSVLFIHQPIYNRVIEFFEKRMKLLKTSGDLRLKSNNLVKRAVPSVDTQQIRNEGVKIFPHDSDFSEPTMAYDIGTSCDIMASSSPNLGHVLFVISYRSNTELLSLANNYGEDNEVFIHSTNLANIKEIASNIKGTKIWVNCNRRSNSVKSTPRQRQALGKLLLKAENEKTLPTKSERDEFLKDVLLAEKALKVWSSTKAEKRHSSVAEAFLSAVTNGSTGGIADNERFLCLSDLMRVAGRMFNENENEASQFSLTQYKPYGITVLVLLNPENLSLMATLIPILLSLLKGNVVLVVSVTKSVNPYSDSILNSFNCTFPRGSVQFIQSPNISHAIQLISHPGKVSLLWLIHLGIVYPEMDQILFTSFSKVIVSHGATIGKSIVPNGRQLEIVKNIFL